MNKPNKCKNCQWYGKPYWSIINPCDSCPNENDYMTIVQIDGKPVFKEILTEEEIKKAMTDKSIFELTIEEKDKEIDRLNNIINELEKWLKDKVFNKAGSSIDIAIENHTYSKVLDRLQELKEGDK